MKTTRALATAVLVITCAALLVVLAGCGSWFQPPPAPATMAEVEALEQRIQRLEAAITKLDARVAVSASMSTYAACASLFNVAMQLGAEPDEFFQSVTGLSWDETCRTKEAEGARGT